MVKGPHSQTPRTPDLAAADKDGAVILAVQGKSRWRAVRKKDDGRWGTSGMLSHLSYSQFIRQTSPSLAQ